jgi:glucose-1-phosphate thymidylyltransferase
MVTIILAAGYGTRLYPLTLDKPKALLPVGGKTILDRLVSKIKLVKSSKEIVIVTNEKFYKNFETRAKIGVVEIINDGTKSNETKLGAIGDIGLVLRKKNITEDLLITGSDNLFDLDLREFIKFAEAKRPFSSMALFDVKDKALAKKYGICELDKDCMVTDFQEKPEFPKSTLAATALYYIPGEKVAKISDYMKTDLPKDAPGNLMKWLSKVDKLFGYVLDGMWYDIGDMKSLKKADEEFKKKEKEQ